MVEEQRDSQCRDRRRTHKHPLIHVHGLRGRRRQHRRQEDQLQAQRALDWHDPQLLTLSLAIMVLCVADAHNTLQLLQLGAKEMNAFMDYLIQRDIELFVAVKLGMTAVCLVVLVGYQHIALFQLVKIRHLLYVICAFYAGLISYELAIWPGPHIPLLFIPF